MQLIQLTRNQHALVDDEDYFALVKFNWCCDSTGYATRSVEGKNRRMHRLLMNPPAGMDVDHINGNKLDNRRRNLRVVTHAQNMQNMKVHRDSKSGCRGVHFRVDTGKWTAQICVNGKRYTLGSHRLKSQAVKAYKQAAIVHYGKIYQR